MELPLSTLQPPNVTNQQHPPTTATTEEEAQTHLSFMREALAMVYLFPRTPIL